MRAYYRMKGNDLLVFTDVEGLEFPQIEGFFMSFIGSYAIATKYVYKVPECVLTLCSEKDGLMEELFYYLSGDISIDDLQDDLRLMILLL